MRRGLACGRKSRLSGRRRTGCLLKPCDVHNAQNLKLVSALRQRHDAASRTVRTSFGNLWIGKRTFITANRFFAVRLTHRDGDPTVNKETKLDYTFADADEGLPRISEYWRRGQQRGGKETSIFGHLEPFYCGCYGALRHHRVNSQQSNQVASFRVLDYGSFSASGSRLASQNNR